MSAFDKALQAAIYDRPDLDEPGMGYRSIFSDGFRSGWEACADHHQAVIAAARALLAEIDNVPAAPEQDGLVGRLRETLENLDEQEER